MSSDNLKLEKFFNNQKNFYFTYFFLVVFLCAVKIPSLLSSDIQPWDEGMYASRVLSIINNGDFIDQSSHSVGNFYSGSHPPLLIWLGYFASEVFGLSAVTLKLLIFVISLLAVLLIMLTGKKLFDPLTGFFASIIFCSNIIFEVFSQRFQFDMPYTFFILLSFYLIFIYNDTLKKRYLILSGLSFGCCLMIKILVGFYIPIILVLSYFFIKGKVNYSLKDIFIVTAIGVAAALPWHVYMIANYGSEFTDYFFKFHIFDRALHGVEMNEKRSGVFYHINYFLSILPFGVIAFLCLIKNLKNYKSLSWQNIFVCVWFLAGLFIISLFKTKLEVYVLLILIPGSFLIPIFIKSINSESGFIKTAVILFTLLNIFWFATESIRPELKIFATENKLMTIPLILVLLALLFLAARYLADKIELKKIYYIFILIFFIGANMAYLFNVPKWVNKFQLSEIKKYSDNGNAENIIYIGTNFRYNPQFSFYFEGLDLNPKNPKYKYKLLDTKDGFEMIKNNLTQSAGEKNLVIVEKDYINRADYPDSYLFIPENYKLVMKRSGYELFEN